MKSKPNLRKRETFTVLAAAASAALLVGTLMTPLRDAQNSWPSFDAGSVLLRPGSLDIIVDYEPTSARVIAVAAVLTLIATAWFARPWRRSVSWTPGVVISVLGFVLLLEALTYLVNPPFENNAPTWQDPYLGITDFPIHPSLSAYVACFCAFGVFAAGLAHLYFVARLNDPLRAEQRALNPVR